MTEQIFTAPDGTVMAIVPKAELDELRQQAEDAWLAAVAVDAERRFKAGLDEKLPWDFAKRLLRGDNPVRLWREHRGLTVAGLAAAAGISQPYLSQIESGQRDGTMKVMASLARVLKVDLDDLAPPDSGSAPEDGQDQTRLLIARAHRDATVGRWFERARELALSLARGEGREQVGRDGIRYYVNGMKACEIHPRPEAQPPQLGVWVRSRDEDLLNDARHPGHRRRKGWISVHQEAALPAVLKHIREAFRIADLD